MTSRYTLFIQITFKGLLSGVHLSATEQITRREHKIRKRPVTQTVILLCSAMGLATS